MPTDQQQKSKRDLTFQDAITGAATTFKDMTQIAPDVYAGGIPAEAVPPVGFVSWKRLPDGSYLPVVRTFQARLRLTHDIGRQLGVGMPGTDVTRSMYETIRRLIQSGFIKARQFSPGAVEIDLNSFWDHYQKSSQPGFWTKERRRRYRRINRGGGGAILPRGEDEE